MALVPKSNVSMNSLLPDQEKEEKQVGEFDNVDAIVFKESGNVDTENYRMAGVISYVEDRFQKAKDKRKNDDERWQTAYRNFRGIYSPETQFTSAEQSKVFIKVTKTKVLAAYAQVTDVLFAANKFPIGIEATPIPEGVPSTVSVDVDPNAAKNPTKELTATVSRPAILASLKAIQEKIDESGITPKEGATGLPSELVFSPADEAAEMMEKAIHDQLDESNADKHIRSVALECALLGTGIMKGPFTELKEYPKWTKEGNYEPVTKVVPKVSYVSLWNCYPDPDARNMAECEYFIERHRMSRSELRALKANRSYRSESIDKAIEYGPNYEPETWERTIQDNPDVHNIERYEVLEFWGVIDRQTAEENHDFVIPREMQSKDSFQVNIWVCNGQLLRMIINPFKPSRIPYHAVPYEINPYSFFGVGVAENMEDTQLLMNGFMRMAVDNGAKAGNLMVEVNEDMLVPGQDMEIYPGKVWRRSGGAPGQAIFGTSFPDTSQSTMTLFDRARQLADESTGMPSYAHGGTGVTGVGRTASGMSMLMGAAAQNIKSVVRNFDDYLLTPLGKDFFAFNMQFNFKEKYTEGDLEVVARGTESLMRNEVRSQKLMQLMQIGANPMMAPLIKWDTVLREIAASLEIDQDKFINDPRAAMLQASVMAQHQQMMGGPQGAQATGGGPPGISDPTGTGNGNIAPGAAPEPNAAGFTGGGGATGAGAQANAQAAQQQG